MPITLADLSKAFGPAPVLRSVSERFADGEISVLLGPSGCGKTTILRCIAGLERPSGGLIDINGRIVYRDRPPIWVPVERRKIAMVFQSYAIWPHMTAFQNVSLPLQAAGVDRRTIQTRVTETLELVGLGGVGQRSATQLSGGQQQRVALARCIISGSPVILMDEPLSNLDANLRMTMRTEIRDLQRRLGQTVLFVTHDQEEAMSIADTIYLLRDGSVVQQGRPKEIYENPRSRYAAEFLGRANILAEFSRATESDRAMIGLGRLSVRAPPGMPDEGATLCVRPEKWRVVGADRSDALTGRILETRYVGDRLEFVLDTTCGRIAVIEISRAERKPGDLVGLTIEAVDVKWLP